MKTIQNYIIKAIQDNKLHIVNCLQKYDIDEELIQKQVDMANQAINLVKELIPPTTTFITPNE